MNRGLEPHCYYWRDQQGLEIYCLLEDAGTPVPVEIKAGKTVTSDYFQGLQSWNRLSGGSPEHSFVVYAGEEEQIRSAGGF